MHFFVIVEGVEMSFVVIVVVMQKDNKTCVRSGSLSIYCFSQILRENAADFFSVHLITPYVGQNARDEVRDAQSATSETPKERLLKNSMEP